MSTMDDEQTQVSTSQLKCPRRNASFSDDDIHPASPVLDTVFLLNDRIFRLVWAIFVLRAPFIPRKSPQWSSSYHVSLVIDCSTILSFQ